MLVCPASGVAATCAAAKGDSLSPSVSIPCACAAVSLGDSWGGVAAARAALLKSGVL